MIHMLLIILGAIGFPVLMEVKQFLSKGDSNYFVFAIYKIDDNNIFALVVVGTIMIFTRTKSFLAGKSWHETVFYTLFNL